MVNTMSNDITKLEELREQFRRDNPHLTNLPPARNETREEIAAREEAKRARLIQIRKQLEAINAKRNQPQGISSAIRSYLKQDKK
jgi:hypothetical protein